MKRLAGWGLVLGLAMVGGVYAARPLAVDDAEPVAKEKFQFQAGALYREDAESLRWDFPMVLGYGVGHGLEVGAGFGWQVDRQESVLEGHETRQGVEDLIPYAKWKFLEQEKFFFDQTLTAFVKLPTASRNDDLGSGKADYGLTWIATRQITDNLAADLNIGYTWMGDNGDEGNPASDILFYGAALRWQMTRTLQPVAEIFALDPVDVPGDTQVTVNGGIRWQVSEQVTLDAAVGTGLRGDAPHVIATAGVTWTF